MVDERLLNIILCPFCGSKLKEEEKYLVCLSCEKEFLVKQGIPILLKEYI